MPGLQNDYSINSLLNMGFTTIYNQTYGYATKDAEIIDLKKNCTPESILCVGGGQIGNDNMRLVACGNCFSVLNVTALNTPNYVGSAFWYFTPTKSFGFSPSSSINQYTCDYIESNDNFRLCWHTDGSSAGYRIGNVVSFDDNYSKYAFLKTSNYFFFLIF